MFLSSVKLWVGVQNPILRSMNSRAGRGDNNSGGLGCSLHHTVWETNLWFIPSPSSNINCAVSQQQQQHSQTWTGNTFHSWWVAAIGSATNSVLFSGVKRCCCNCKYIMWEKVLRLFRKVFQMKLASRKNTKSYVKVKIVIKQQK